MRSEALENIVTMLRTQAAERGDAQMTVAEWRTAYDGLGALLPAAEGVRDRSGIALRHVRCSSDWRAGCRRRVSGRHKLLTIFGSVFGFLLAPCQGPERNP